MSQTITEHPATVAKFSEGIDRRRSTREPVLTPGTIRDTDGESPFGNGRQVLVTDVSLHGSGFRSAEALERDQMFFIEIGVGPLHLSARLRVVRCRQRPDGTYDVGGEFC